MSTSIPLNNMFLDIVAPEKMHWIFFRMGLSLFMSKSKAIAWLSKAAFTPISIRFVNING
jgi:hypothetical protein